MAGLLGFLGGGGKEGKGVDKNEPQKRRFFIFFDVFFRKFFKMVQVNLLYVLFSLPYLILLYFISPLNLDAVKQISAIGDFIKTITTENALELDILMRAMFAFFIVTFWGSGPASAGMGMVLRNYARESHAWVWGDFWEAYKKNFKSSVLVLILDMVVLYFGVSAFMFYRNMYALSNGDRMMLVMQGILLLAFILYTMMHYYIYQIMISFDGKTGSLYRNSFLFTLAKFPLNLVLSVISMAIFVFMFVSLNSYAMAVSAVILTVLCTFILSFYTSDVVRRASENK